ncbi:uncharacterized protein [Fopius arisanus]|uniref:Uncharacterized protein isoform X1 n=1 Tax=Fopius arisanus TaxID=64838 RepID=A0A9R1TE66_9HYME|nr:PREDICTED: uncharacterized protein LOC105269142 isoform X1 [Fopius arisanus]
MTATSLAFGLAVMTVICSVGGHPSKAKRTVILQQPLEIQVKESPGGRATKLIVESSKPVPETIDLHCTEVNKKSIKRARSPKVLVEVKDGQDPTNSKELPVIPLSELSEDWAAIFPSMLALNATISSIDWSKYPVLNNFGDAPGSKPNPVVQNCLNNLKNPLVVIRKMIKSILKDIEDVNGDVAILKEKLDIYTEEFNLCVENADSNVPNENDSDPSKAKPSTNGSPTVVPDLLTNSTNPVLIQLVNNILYNLLRGIGANLTDIPLKDGSIGQPVTLIISPYPDGNLTFPNESCNCHCEKDKAFGMVASPCNEKNCLNQPSSFAKLFQGDNEPESNTSEVDKF